MISKTGPRERILETASRLFYSQGYNNTGINQILAEANVAKASLYQHFGSKDELGVFYLKTGRQEWFSGMDQWTNAKKTPVQKLLACFDFLEYALQKDDYLGCKFINMLSEIGSTSPLMLREIVEHKGKLRQYMKNFVEKALDGTPEEETEMMGDAIYLMFEGAIVESKIYRNTWPVKKARRMTEILVKGNE
ncbi:TetR/AcrR family transcriptional regulator [Dyadobacter pollutisoli]|uniref:TetR/AcrR family transcriptional regulator n=1 Tax=Dyadobacter pollutisoli TaxID=2910158 RepID=A0A9E8NES6_9BACT|nr:TetR/AcrR family transcriptional regulator [Dyadobacter pollutisoli]WAC12987.1 TetR/AcrR family transcriptional regulator [Dyadobacter pollutisoli]